MIDAADEGQRASRATTASAATGGSSRARAGRCASARPTRARRSSSTSSAASPRSRTRIIEDFVVAALATARAMFLLANVVDDVDMGITHVIRGEEHLPNTPKAPAAVAGARWGDRAGVRPHAAAREREAPEAVEAARHGRARALPRRGLSCPRRCATTSCCSAGRRPTTARSCRSRRSSSCSGSRTSTRRPRSSTSKKLDGVQRRVHPGAVDRRSSSTPRSRGSCAARAVAPRAFRSRRVRDDGAARAGAGHARWSRCRRWSTSCSLDEPKLDRASWDKAMKAPACCRRSWTVRSRPTPTCRWEADALKGALERDRRGCRAQARQGAGAGAGGRDRSHRRSAAVRVARGARTGAHTGAARCCPRTTV